MLKTLRSFEHEDDDLAVTPQPAPPDAHQAQRRRAQRSCLLLAAGGFGLIGLAGCGSGRSANIAVTSCQADPNGGQPTASGTIHNNRGDRGYTFDLRFHDASGREVSHQTVTINSIAKDGDANWDAKGISFYKGDVTCTVGSVKKLKGS